MDARLSTLVTRVAGRGFHQPCERGVRVHAGTRAGARGGRGLRTGAASRSPHVPVSLLLLHGQRDLLPAQALPRGGQQGQVLGPLPAHREPAEPQHAAHQC